MKQAVRKGITLLLSLCMAMCFATVAMAEGQGTEYVAWIGERGYTTLTEAVNAARSGDTITLGEGTYTLYQQGAQTKGKDLTFVGQGADKTTWIIGAKTPDETLEGTEYNGDYSFDGAGTILFEGMTLNSGNKQYLGFIRPDNTIVDNCIINGCTYYWGYSSAIFQNTVFNAKKTDAGKAEYSIYTYSSPKVTFDSCTFNCDGKAIKVYQEGSTTKDNPIYINVNDCVFNFKEDNKCAVNVDEFKNYYVVSFNGDNIVNGGNRNTDSCSRLFQIDTGVEQYRNTAQILTGDKTVWENGQLVSHDYSDGHKDNAFSNVTYTNWTKQADGTVTRTCTAVCDYCGFEEVTQEVCDHGDSKTVGYVAATCTEKGYSGDTVCTVCEKTVAVGQEIDINPNNHDLKLVEAVAATTEAPGNLAYYTCSRCGKWFWDKAATKEIANEKDVVIAKLPADTEGVKDTVVVPEEKQVDKTQTNSAEAIAAAENLQVDEVAVAANGVEIAKAIQSNPENIEQAKTELKAALGSEYSETDTVLLVVKPYVEVTPKAAELEGGIQKVELEISMKYDLQATIPGKTTVELSKGNDMDKEQIKADTVVTVTLPASFSTSNGVIVRHDATANGYGIQYYISTVDNQNVTFKVPAEHGFSPFTLMSNSSVNVKLDGVEYTYTSNDVAEGKALPAASKYNYAFKGWKFEGIDGQYFNMTAELFEALLDKNAVVIGSSVFEGPMSEHPEIEEAKKNGTWGVDDNTPAPTAKPAAAAVTPVRTSSIPKTSDDSNLMLWVCLMGIAALGLGGAVYMKKRNHQ